MSGLILKRRPSGLSALVCIFAYSFCFAQSRDPRTEIERQRQKTKQATGAKVERASSRPRVAVTDPVELALKRGDEAAGHLKVEEAEKWYRQALALNPNEARAYVGLGHAYGFWPGVNRKSDVRQAYETAIRLKPDYADAYFAMAQTVAVDDSERIELLKQTLRYAPKNYMANYKLGNIYFLQKRYGEALEQFQRMAQLKPNWDPYYQMGEIYVIQERYEEAIKAYRQSLRLSSDTNVPLRLENAYYLFGLEALKNKDRSKALEQYRQLRALKSTYAEKLLAKINEQ